MTEQPDESLEPHNIGVLNEGSLHRGLKEYYFESGDRLEVPHDRFVIDLVRGDTFFEFQTGSLGAMGNKLDHLLPAHPIVLVHPIAVDTWLDRLDQRERKSPKHGSLYSIFEELVSVPTLLDHPNLILDVLLIDQTRIQIPDPKARRGRGGYRTVDRRLRAVREVHRFTSLDDLAELLPADLPTPFTTADIAEGATVGRDIGQRMAYTFKHAGVIVEVGRDKRGYLYQRVR